MKYRRILLKLSGEALMGNKQYGIDPERLNEYADQIKLAASEGVEIGIVIGGGNIFRGLQGAAEGFDRIQGDYMGMLATVINSMAIQAALNKQDVRTRLLSGFPVGPFSESMSSDKAISYLETGNIVIMCAGTGNPFFTTDTASALRAAELKADVILKGTRVDGVYSDDPEKNPKAVKYNKLSFDEAYQKKLKIMDLTAFTLCKQNHIPILVFNMNEKNNLFRIIKGESIGTLVTP